ncbi:vacuolar protein sorting-associated protein 13B [Sergentomyia squamirostris]
MFRIESYLTPIILHHLEKYVKNIRPQDAQLSLWNGEWAFQNLDLKLEVLEEELNMPFSFLSGHIHELVIRVPWTKLGSEPINITINTIEFVLKLREVSPDGNPQNRERSRKKPKPEDFQAPPGYMASLVNKIANNISVQCHNIIFKYLEEDIVLSMNIQLLSVDSADEEWNPAFIDVSPIKVFLRKIVNITDLTICLDKRNETGKIEVCQEPILYRCSMQVRLFRRYNISTAHKSSVLRMDVHTKSIDLNISSLQFPMVLRLMKLILALKDGNLRQKNARQEAEQEPENAEEGDSVFSWVWNLLPSLLPGEDAIEDDQESHGHVLHCGAYADEVKMTFKNQEIISDSFVHTTKKIKYNPILTVKLSGSYCDTIIMGKHWFSTTGGVSSIKIFPTGDCVCGQKHFLQEFLSTDDVQDMHYMEGSIYDPKTEENLGIHRSYRMFWDFYYLKHTSVSLLNKTPALAFDLVHEVEIPEDIARSSDLGSDLEFSDLSEKCLQRVFFGPFTIRYGQGVAHLIETFQGYIKSYNYAPYLEEKPRLSFSQLSPASTDDYDALMSEIPLQVYEVSFTDATLEIYTGDHEKTGHRSVRKKNSRDSLHPRAIEPSCRFNTESLEGRMETPMYPNRLIHTTCQLPNPPDNLFDACYTKFFLDMKNSGCFLRKENNLLTIPDISGSYSYLLLPELWDNERVSRMKMHLTIPKIEMSFNRLQVQHLKESFMELMYNSGSEYSGDMFDPNLPMIQTTLDGMTMAVNKTKHTSIFTGSLQTVFGVVIIPSASYESVIFRQNTREHFFEVTLQMNQTTMVYPPILRLQIGEVSLNLDPLLMDFLMYDFTPEKTSQEGKFRGSLASVSLDIGKKIIPDKLSKRPSKKTLESVHSSSEKNTAVVFSRRDDLPKKQKSLTESYSMWKNLAIAGRMKSWRIIIPEGSLQCRKREESFEEVLKRSKNLQAVILNLPQLQIQSSGPKITSDSGRLDFPLILPWEKSKDSFPWSVTLSDFSCDIIESGKKRICLESVTTNISLAITYKAEIVEKTDVPFAAIFHIDITPLVIKMSVDQLQLLLSTLRRIQSLPWIASLLVERDDLEVTSLEIAHRSTSPDSDVDLKDFFGMKTSSTHEMSSDVTEVIREARSPAKGSLWLQWTLTKITANFYSSTPTGVRQKLVLEFEDIISSIDLRDIYVKLKAKIGYFACNSFLMDNPGVWRQNEMMGVCGRTPETSDPNYTFLDVTVTKAETSNVHNKWGASKKNRNLNESLTEVMVNMQQIDFKIDPNFLQSFVEFLKIFLNSQAVSREKEIMKMRKKDVKITSVADLPLIYFNCKGFRVLVPVEDNNGSYNVCILKVGSIGVASTVENPLTRTPVRSDIYTKAAQLRILSIPGSKIEDRQYELTLKNITIGTGKWQEVVGLMEGTADGSIVYNDNPAFVWNNQSSKTSIDINAIFKDFTCSLIFAPCIVFNNILVCGQGLEFNALTDLSIHLNTDQLSMALSLWSKIQSFQQILNSTKRKCLQKDKKSPVFKKIPPRFKRIPEKTEYDVKDSGFESIDIEKKSSVEGNQERFLKEAEVPYDISFVGGVFTVNLYHHESCLQATLCIFQPNLFLTQGVYEKTTQMSVFDMNVILSNIPGKDQEKTEDVILSTSKGELNPMGIASPILRVKLHRSIANQSNLDIQLGRHMKITTSDQTLRIVFEWKRILEQTIPGDLVRDREAESSVRKPANIIKNVQMSILGCEHLTLKLDHMEIVTKTDDRQVKMILRDFNTNVGMLERPLGAQIDVTLGLLAVITHQYTFIHPTSITLSGSIVRESWQKTPLCTFRVSSKYLHVDIGPETLLTFQAIHTSILRLCYEFGALSRESLKGFEEESCEKSQEPSQHLIPIKIPKMKDSEDTKVHEEHYSDDLRAGAFQFIELKSDKSLPLPYQIQIINLDVGIICWRYPQPRAISKVDVFPVPFPMHPRWT